MRTQTLAAALALLASAALQGQISSVSCIAGAAPVLLRSEGLTEPAGDIVLTCSGGAPLAQISTNLTLFAPVNVTNRLGAGDTLDVSLTIDTGSGPVPAGVAAVLASPSSVAFNGLNFRLSASGGALLRISNLRLAARQLPASLAGQPVQVFLASAGQSPIAISNNPVSAGVAMTGLLAGSSPTQVVCTGSRLPDLISFSNLLAAGTRFASTRLTEGAADSFRKKGPGDDIGTRILVRYTGFPAGARLFVPDAIAGSSAVQATSAGDLGLPASGGKYAPSSAGSLLLARVAWADPSGQGGIPAYQPGPPGSGTVSFDALSEVSLTGGAGYAVYEVMDANPSLRESAQLPTFLALGPSGGGDPIVASWSVSLAPVSSVATASSTAPTPRFAWVTPPADCTALGDCSAPYFPRLLVDATPPLDYMGVAGGGHQAGYVRIVNEGGGVLIWRVAIAYQTGSGWLRAAPSEGVGNATIRVDALPANLTPGLYRATLTVDAGPLAGSRTLPVTLQVTPAPPPAPPPPVIESIVNAAGFRPGPLAPGSLAAIFGLRLAGGSVTAAFDGVAARLLYTGERQINLQVPAELAGRSSARVTVTVDGVASAPYAVALAAAAPGIFGVLNQDFSLNGPAAPALAGSVIQIFATGLPDDGAGVSVKIHDRLVTAPLYAGPAPGLLGVQQVNAAVPADLPAMSSEVVVCAAGACSPPAPLFLAR
jgi:uncharacterized protein (TIGR03437 family)